MQMLMQSMADRDSKIAAFKQKKLIEANLDRLKNYQDEEMQREFYMTQVQYSIMNTFEQLNMTAMEMEMHKHRA